MPNYKRIRLTGGTYFFRVNLHDRSKRLLTSHIEGLKRSFAETKRVLAFRIDAIVVLPDHLHCIWTMPPNDSNFSERWQLIKADFSRRIPRQEVRSNSRAKRRERAVWQRRFWEHVIRDEASRAAHFDYIHYNPVKHGYVTSPTQWPYSSFHRFVQAGVYPHDWAACIEMVGSAGER
jgi:putative transposase